MTFEELVNLYKEAEKNPWEFFKVHTLKEMLRISHPDKWRDYDSTQIFTSFPKFHKASLTPIVMVGKYPLLRSIRKGDLREVWASDQFIVKVPLVDQKAANNLIAKEAATLTFLNKESEGLSYQHYFPKLVDNFLEGKKRIIVTTYPDRIMSLLDIKELYPNGLNGRHIAWMTKRALAILGFLHLKGYCHGAMTPEHIMVCPENKAGVLVGWIHSEKIGDKIKTVPSIRRDWYPESAKLGLTPKIDLVIMAKTMLFMADSLLPKRFKNFLRALELGVNVDAWELSDDLATILLDCYGPPKFVPLVVDITKGK